MSTIYVEGNLIFKSGISWSKNLVAYCDEKDKLKANEIIKGDLVITDKNITKSYDEYLVRDEIECISPNGDNAYCLPNPYYTFKNYRDNISLIEKFGDIDMDHQYSELKYQQLFLSVISNLELFLSETLLNLTLGIEKYYNNYVHYHAENIQKKLVKFNESPELFIYYEIKRINCHQLDGISKYFKKIFATKLLDIDDLEKSVQIRHDLSHRFGFPKEGERQKIDKTKLHKLIKEAEKFVNQIEDNFADDFKTWTVKRSFII